MEAFIYIILPTILVTGGIMSLVIWYMANLRDRAHDWLRQQLGRVQDSYIELVGSKVALEKHLEYLEPRSKALEKIETALTLSKHSRSTHLSALIEEAKADHPNLSTAIVSCVALLNDLDITATGRPTTVEAQASIPRKARKRADKHINTSSGVNTPKRASRTRRKKPKREDNVT